MAFSFAADFLLQTQDTFPEDSRGLFAHFLSLTGSFGRYIQALTSLASEETREAAELSTRMVVMLVAALFFGALGYIFLILAVAFTAAWVLGISWLILLGVFTFVHILLAVLCALQVRNHLRTPLFVSTRREIRRDLETLSARSQP